MEGQGYTKSQIFNAKRLQRYMIVPVSVRSSRDLTSILQTKDAYANGHNCSNLSRYPRQAVK